MTWKNLPQALAKPPVTESLHNDPSKSPEEAWAHHRLSQDAIEKLTHKLKSVTTKESHDDLNEVASFGAYGSARPSPLFLEIMRDIYALVDKNPQIGLVSPKLLASTGVVTLSIVSVIPDIVRHYADCIVRAEKDVFLSTNYWEASTSASVFSNAFRELSKRAGARGQRVVVKLMYDRGTPKQAFQNHSPVKPEDWTDVKVKLPAPSEIPNIDMEVINYHRPPVGTMHSKYMVVDRRIAILSSNNIQDRRNVEMMTQIEGNIVEAFYDMALIVWHNKMVPSPSTLVNPPSPRNGQDYDFGNKDRYMEAFRHGDVDLNARKREAGHHTANLGPDETGQRTSQGESLVEKEHPAPNDETTSAEAGHVQALLLDPATLRNLSIHLNAGMEPDTHPTETDESLVKEFFPLILHTAHDPVPMALVNRPPKGTPGHDDVENPQNAAWLAAMANAKRDVFIQTPTFNAVPAVEGALKAVKRGIEVTIYVDLGFNDAGELLPGQGGTNEDVLVKMYEQLKGEEKDRLKCYWYTAKDQNIPLNASKKARNCHVKIMIVDGHIGIQGNGNQDTQSWYHSQEINFMVDSELVCREWRQGLDANQNTLKYGRVDNDGIWRRDGQPLEDSTGGKNGKFSFLKGVVGAVQRVRGEGGF